ncbi:MAG TPA: YciI family protein [Jatrophihabitantaceae bacterium]|jgi:hypothetical protein
MPKYLLLKHYTGGPERHPNSASPMSEWTEDEITAHVAFLRQVADMLRERGEFVDAQALRPERTYVQYGGPDAAPVTTDGPFPETKELAAGWYMVDVESEARAIEIAAYVSSGPGKGGLPLYEWIEVRPVMTDIPATTE